MQEIDEFSLVPLGDGGDEAPERSTLLHRGVSLPITIDGVILQRQYRCGERYLLLTTADCPFEEALWIRLLSPSFETLDCLEIGAIYAPGDLGDVCVHPDGELEFSFFGDRRWSVELHDAPKRVWKWSRSVPKLDRLPS